MLRRLQNLTGKNIDVQFKAAVPMVRGMVVQKDYANGTAILPTSQEGLFFVDRDIQPTGIITVEGEISDYDERLENIATGDFVQLEKFMSGERFATDQVVATGLAIGDYLEVEVTVGANQGKFKEAEAATGLKYAGTYNDNGHTLHIVEVL